jgi:hypothetical protein
MPARGCAGRRVPFGQDQAGGWPRPAAGGAAGPPGRVLGEHRPGAARVFTWANETCCGTGPVPLREAHAGLLVDCSTWLGRPGRARLMAQLDSLPGVTGPAPAPHRPRAAPVPASNRVHPARR